MLQISSLHAVDIVQMGEDQYRLEYPEQNCMFSTKPFPISARDHNVAKVLIQIRCSSRLSL